MNSVNYTILRGNRPSISMTNNLLDDNSTEDTEQNSAADLVRSKLDRVYQKEPDALDEAIETEQEPAKERSKHQKFMHELTNSGKPLHEIQTAWHNYYLGLTDAEKREVWQEFYDANKTYIPGAQNAVVELPKHKEHHIITPEEAKNASNSVAIKKPRHEPRPKTISEIKKNITSTVEKRQKAKLTRKQHLQSIAFGLGMGSLILLLMLFGFFNERFIAPFITPNKNVSATPIIIDSNTAVGKDPKVIIPKINVELPVVYDVPTIAEEAVQKGLERGVVHYATTPNPGEKGNAVIFGHSSNNLLNAGDYKFAFVLLTRLEIDDTFYIEKEGVRYAYRIFEKKVVKPTEVSVLKPIPGKTAVATLITCDPPGFAINRLVVIGEQISPDPSGNAESTALQTDASPQILAGNAESLWQRIKNWIF